MKFSSIAVGVLVATMGIASSAKAAPITYDVSIALDGGYKETGSITTNGTLGALTLSDITSWTFDLSYAVPVDGQTSTIISSTDKYANITGNAGALTATATGLFFNFTDSSRTAESWWFADGPSSGNDLKYALFLGIGSGSGSVTVNFTYNADTSVSESGDQQIGVAVTPLPGSSLLFLTGFGGVFLFSNRKKLFRKNGTSLSFAG